MIFKVLNERKLTKLISSDEIPVCDSRIYKNEEVNAVKKYEILGK
jgi:hypothetical protein